MNRKILSLGLLIVLVVFGGAGCSTPPPKNVMLFIGDGMGFEQVKAAGMYANGTAGTLCFESFPYKGQVTTYSANADSEKIGDYSYTQKIAANMLKQAETLRTKESGIPAMTWAELDLAETSEDT